MSTLKENLQEIKRQKDTYIKPENLKKDITIFGITGTLEEDNSNKVKVFDTIDSMNNDTNAVEGDTALVLRNEVSNMNSDSIVTSVTFPAKVILPEVITESKDCMLRSEDVNAMFNGNLRLDQQSFSFDGFSMTSMINVQYSSDDGITYTRTEFSSNGNNATNPISFETNVIVDNPADWIDSFGYFMQLGGNIFEGLYTYTKNVQTDEIQFPDLENATINIAGNGDFIYNQKLPKKFLLTKLNQIKYKSTYGIVFVDTDNNLKLLDTDAVFDRFIANSSNEILGIYALTKGTIAKLYTVNYETLELQDEQNLDINTYGSENGTYVAITNIKSAPIKLNSSTRYYSQLSTGIIGDTITNWNWSQKMDLFNYKDQYICMTTQLNASKENVYNSTFYGKNGVETGTLGVDIDTTYFVDTNAKLYSTLQAIYCNTPLYYNGNDLCFIPQDINGNALMDFSGKDNLDMYFYDRTILKCVPKLNIPDTVTSMCSMFSNTYNLEYIADITLPSNMTNLNSFLWMANGNEKLKTAPKINTENVTDFWGMYSGCKALVNVPVYNLASATDLSSMFSGCENLSDDSLNNIMSSLISAVAYTDKKTLRELGITEEQATRCQSLSNYEAFTSAGWTTGY